MAARNGSSIHVNVTEEEHEALKRLQMESGTSMSWHGREAFRQYFKKFGITIKAAQLMRGRPRGR